MAVIFLDTSALVRRYDRTEPGSVRVRAACARPRGNTLLLARLATIEVASALARKTRDGALDPADRTRLWHLFQAHRRDQYRLVDLTEVVYARAEQLLFRHRLRGFDALLLPAPSSSPRPFRRLSSSSGQPTGTRHKPRPMMGSPSS